MKHCILVKFGPDVDMRAHWSDIQSIFEKTKAIEGVREIRLVPGVNREEYKNRYDLMIEMTMDRASLPAYDASDAHHEWKAKYGPMIASKCIFDYE